MEIIEFAKQRYLSSDIDKIVSHRKDQLTLLFVLNLALESKANDSGCLSIEEINKVSWKLILDIDPHQVEKNLMALVNNKFALIDKSSCRFSISRVGMSEIRQYLSIRLNRPSLYLIEKGQVWFSRDIIAELILESTGSIKIVDPYFGDGSLLSLKHFKSKNVQFLTSKIDGVFKLLDFLSEYTKIEIRTLDRNSLGFHDRFAILDEGLMLVGHGFKDVGGKTNSFISYFPKEYNLELHKNLGQEFDQSWILGNGQN